MKATALVVVFSALAIGERGLERAAHAQRLAPSFDVDPRWPKMPVKRVQKFVRRP